MSAFTDQTWIDSPAISPQHFPIICTWCGWTFLDKHFISCLENGWDYVNITLMLWMKPGWNLFYWSFLTKNQFFSHFETILWHHCDSFSDGHCLKCWFSMVAVIFLVTLPLQHLLHCLPTALHKCHNTDMDDNNTWHLDHKCVYTAARAHSH